MFGFIPPQEKIRPEPETEEIDRIKTKEPLTPQERILLADDVADSTEQWQLKVENDRKFIASVKSDLSHLAVTTFESPAEKDPFYGQVASSIKAIHASPTAFDIDRKPPRPEFDN